MVSYLPLCFIFPYNFKHLYSSAQCLLREQNILESVLLELHQCWGEVPKQTSIQSNINATTWWSASSGFPECFTQLSPLGEKPSVSLYIFSAIAPTQSDYNQPKWKGALSLSIRWVFSIFKVQLRQFTMVKDISTVGCKYKYFYSLVLLFVLTTFSNSCQTCSSPFSGWEQPESKLSGCVTYILTVATHRSKSQISIPPALTEKVKYESHHIWHTSIGTPKSAQYTWSDYYRQKRAWEATVRQTCLCVGNTEENYMEWK